MRLPLQEEVAQEESGDWVKSLMPGLHLLVKVTLQHLESTDVTSDYLLAASSRGAKQAT